MATPYSSPDLYFRLQPVESHNWELAGQVLMAKQQKYDANLAQIENLVQQYVGLDIANKDAKNHLYNNLKTLTSEVDRIASSEDLSNSNATKNITSYIGQAIDATTINAVNTTRMKRQYDATWDEIRNKKPELYNNNNKSFGEAGWEDYVNADKDADVSQYVKNGFSVIPYVDIKAMTDKTMMEYMKLAKDKEYSVPIIVNGQQIGFDKWVESGINPVVVKSMMQSQLTPEVRQQMVINSWAQYGGYKGEGATMLKNDYSSYMDTNIKNTESTISNMELELTKYGKGTSEEKQLKKSLSDYRTNLGESKDRKVSTLASIDNGDFTNAGFEMASGRFVDQGVNIFGSFYAKYFKGTEANEIFWKDLEFKQKQFEFSEDMKIKQAQYDLDVEKLNYLKTKDERDEQTMLDSGIQIQNSAEILGAKQSSKDVINLELVGLKNQSSGMVKDWVKEIDDILVNNSEDRELFNDAKNLRSLYIKELGLSNKQAGLLSIESLTARYDKYRTKLTNVLTESVGVNSRLSTLNTRDETNRAQQLDQVNSEYKQLYRQYNKIVSDQHGSLFSQDVIKNTLSSKSGAEVMVNRGGTMVVEKASEAFKKYVNEDGSWKNTTTENQKKAVTDRIRQTYDIQSGRLNSELQKGQKTTESPIVKEWLSLSANDKYRLANKVPTTFRVDQTSSNQQATKRFDRLREQRSSTQKDVIISATLANGKVNPEYVKIANLFNQKNGVVLDTSAGNTITMKPRVGGGYNFSANTINKVKGENVVTPTTMSLNSQDVHQGLPSIISKVGGGSQPKPPTNTFENLGRSKISVNTIPYYKDNEVNHVLSLTKGNTLMADALTVNGAISYIKNSDQQTAVAYQGLSNVFENFDQKLKEKISDVNGKYRIDVGFSADRNSADISLVTKDGTNVVTIKRNLDSDGSIDTLVEQTKYTPASIVNSMISELIRKNYYNTNSGYDNESWKIFMGDLKRK